MIPLALVWSFLSSVTVPFTTSIISPSTTLRFASNNLICQSKPSGSTSDMAPGDANIPHSIACPSIAGPAAAEQE